MKTNYGYLSALVCCLAASGCEVTPEKIQTWKTTQKGEAKIRAAVRDEGQTLDVRILGAEALCELKLFEPLAEDLKAIKAEQRGKLVAGLTKRLQARMQGSNPAATTGIQVQAKDSLFELRNLSESVPAEIRTSIDDSVARWMTQDWAKRASGEHSGEKIIRTLGKAAAPHLIDGIGGGISPVLASMLLRELGSQADRDRGAEKLLTLAASEKPSKEETFTALGKIGSLKAVDYFLKVAQKGAFQERLWAVRAIGLFPHARAIPTAVAIARDATLTDDRALLRDAAFTLLEKTNDDKSLVALLSFLGDKNKLVHYRASEAVLVGFGARGLTMLLEQLPSRYTYEKQDLVDFVEKDILKLGQKALPALRNALTSKNWIARLIGARMLGQLGTKQDMGALEKLAGDQTRLNGWEGGATVGSEAAAAAKKLKK